MYSLLQPFVNCSLNIKQHSDLFLPFLYWNSLYTGRISSSEEEWAKSRTQNYVFRYPDLCISWVVVLASELWDFYFSTGSLDEKSFIFFPPSFFLGLSGDTSKRKAVIADRVSHWSLPNWIVMYADVILTVILEGMASALQKLIQLTLECVHVPLLLRLWAGF